MVNNTSPFPPPTMISKSVTSTSTNHSGNITGATKTGGKKNTQYGGVTYTGPVVRQQYTPVSGVNSQQTATVQATTSATANAQATNDAGANGWNTTPTVTSIPTSGGGRRKSRRTKKSRKTRRIKKSRKHKRRNTYKK